MGYLAPTIGVWYQDETDGKLFEVVAIDDKSSSIEVQYEDGNIGEFEIESWGELPLLPAAAPEDANAAYEAGFEEEWGEEFNYLNGNSNPLETIEPESFPGFDDIF